MTLLLRELEGVSLGADGGVWGAGGELVAGLEVGA